MHIATVWLGGGGTTVIRTIRDYLRAHTLGEVAACQLPSGAWRPAVLSSMIGRPAEAACISSKLLY